jgi:hypothetical protein
MAAYGFGGPVCSQYSTNASLLLNKAIFASMIASVYKFWHLLQKPA